MLSALVGVGAACRSGAYVSVFTIATAVLFLATGLSIDAWAGLVMSAIICKAGGEAYAILHASRATRLRGPGRRKAI